MAPARPGSVKKDGPSVDIETYAFVPRHPNPLVVTAEQGR